MSAAPEATPPEVPAAPAPPDLAELVRADAERRVRAVEADIKASVERNRCEISIEARAYFDEQGALVIDKRLVVSPRP